MDNQQAETTRIDVQRLAVLELAWLAIRVCTVGSFRASRCPARCDESPDGVLGPYLRTPRSPNHAVAPQGADGARRAISGVKIDWRSGCVAVHRRHGDTLD